VGGTCRMLVAERNAYKKGGTTSEHIDLYEDNIQMDLREIIYGDVGSIQLAEDVVQWRRSFVKTAVKAGNVLSS